MILRHINPDTLKPALALRQQNDFVWIDSASIGDFSIMAWNASEKISFEKEADSKSFRHFLKSLQFEEMAELKKYDILFQGGWIGYLSYESYAFSEQIRLRPKHYKNYPVANFSHYETFLYFDHKRSAAYFISFAANGEDLWKEFQQRLESVQSIEKTNLPPYQAGSIRALTGHETYQNNFKTIQNAISNGEFYELNYTQEFEATFKGDAFSFYLNLRDKAPAPQMAYMKFDDVEILSASPECFFKIQNRKIQLFPIKGTIRKSSDSQEDEKLRSILFSSEKEQAELLMVTDLLRNDLGRICKIGSITVENLKKLATFSHYHHLISEISGLLKDDVTLWNVFNALFPGGSITGAPKIRVMETIDRLEGRAIDQQQRFFGIQHSHPDRDHSEQHAAIRNRWRNRGG
jgi:anthranilate/para-aminobenzoate synthase component I